LAPEPALLLVAGGAVLVGGVLLVSFWA